MNAFKRQTMQVLYTWVTSLRIKRNVHSHSKLHEMIFFKVCFVLYNLVIGTVLFSFYLKLQIKSDRTEMKVIKKSFLRLMKVWATYSATIFSITTESGLTWIKWVK